ncbi:MAG: class I tRNA ligase family protein [Lacunisphaera sp.]
MAQDLKDSLLLPKTDFPMRADLVKREPGRVAHWEKLDLYGKIQAARAGRPAFVLHDGPPFTNGDVHIGTALNKSLKDFVNRYKSMRGFRTPYVPGWDCHGLPIEQKVTQEIREKNLTLTTAELRAKCDAFSESWIAKQTTQFKRVGVLADWKNEYKTKAPAFEADILRTFAAFVEQGLVYRSKKPVYWSIPFETALAEAEIEYKDHTSIAIWVKFLVPVEEAKKFGLPADKPLYLVIWTTTPWTIPANLAIALHPDVEYSVADTGAERIIVASALLSTVVTAAKIEPQPTVVLTVSGAKLEKLQTRHPFIDRPSPVVLADYVTTDSGTGAVHTAPGHGAEDYQTGLKYGLEIYCPGRRRRQIHQRRAHTRRPRRPDHARNRRGSRREEARARQPRRAQEARRDPRRCSRKPSTSTATRIAGAPRHPSSSAPSISGSLPSTRRATARSPSTKSRRSRSITAGFPPGAKPASAAPSNRVPTGASAASARGVCRSSPFTARTKKPTSTPAWFAPSPTRSPPRAATSGTVVGPAGILEGIKLPAGWPAPDSLTCGRDTLDVWLDSGSTQAAVLKRGQGGTSWPADLYLEGSDQHRGWFQSSLWNSVIAFGAAPYKAVLTHGFIVDKNRQKISKSSTYQKPQTADAYIAQHGADVIRLWIASQDFRDDIPVDEEILKHVGEAYRLFRNTLRFQLSNLFDFDAARHAVPVAKLDALDRWALHQAAILIEECTKAYDAYEFHRVYQLCNQFCSVTLSAVYHDILKDRLYTLGAAHPLRRSSQTALAAIFDALVRILAPVLTFTTDEAWSYAQTGQEYSNESIHWQDWPVAPADWKNPALAAEFDQLFKLRAKVTEALEPLRQAGTIGKSLDAVLALAGGPRIPRTPCSSSTRTFCPSFSLFRK